MKTNKINRLLHILLLFVFLLPQCFATEGFDPDWTIHTTTGPTTQGPLDNRTPDGGAWMRVRCQDKDGKVVGMATAYRLPDGSIEYGNIDVDEGLKGRGIGTKLNEPIFTELAPDATEGATIWAKDNRKVYDEAIDRGLSEIDALNETPGAHMWGKHGFRVSGFNSTTFQVTLRKLGKTIPCAGPVILFCIAIPEKGVLGSSVEAGGEFAIDLINPIGGTPDSGPRILTEDEIWFNNGGHGNEPVPDDESVLNDLLDDLIPDPYKPKPSSIPPFPGAPSL